MSGSLFVPRLARVVAAQPGGRGSRRARADHRRGHVAVAAAHGPQVAASRVRRHEASRTRHPSHLVTARSDARLQGPTVSQHGPVYRPRTGRLGRGSGHHLQSGGHRGRSTGRCAATTDGLFGWSGPVANCRRRRLATRPYAPRPPRRRRHHQEPRSRPNTRYPVTVGRTFCVPRGIAPAHGKQRACFESF